MKNLMVKKSEISTPIVFILTSSNDIDLVIDRLRERKPVIVNFSSIGKREAYRVIDFLSGFCYAQNGNFKKIDDLIYRFEI